MGDLGNFPNLPQFGGSMDFGNGLFLPSTGLTPSAEDASDFSPFFNMDGLAEPTTNQSNLPPSDWYSANQNGYGSVIQQMNGFSSQLRFNNMNIQPSLSMNNNTGGAQGLKRMDNGIPLVNVDPSIFQAPMNSWYPPDQSSHMNNPQQMHTAVMPDSSLRVSAPELTGPGSEVTSRKRQRDDDDNTQQLANPSFEGSSEPPKKTRKPRKKKELTKEEEKEKKQKFLARNRDAAQKCRQKKKQANEGLQNEYDDLANINNALNTQMAELLTELIETKQEAISHAESDCSEPLIQQWFTNFKRLDRGEFEDLVSRRMPGSDFGTAINKDGEIDNQEPPVREPAWVKSRHFSRLAEKLVMTLKATREGLGIVPDPELRLSYFGSSNSSTSSPISSAADSPTSSSTAMRRQASNKSTSNQLHAYHPLNAMNLDASPTTESGTAPNQPLLSSQSNSSPYMRPQASNNSISNQSSPLHPPNYGRRNSQDSAYSPASNMVNTPVTMLRTNSLPGHDSGVETSPPDLKLQNDYEMVNNWMSEM